MGLCKISPLSCLGTICVHVINYYHNLRSYYFSGTDDEDVGGSKRKKKTTKTTPAKRARHETDSSDSDEEKDADMRNLTEKERELQIFKHIEHQELLKTR